jgi:molybdate transport system permease protein
VAVSADELSVVLFTLEIAAISTALILPLGVAAAWLLARFQFPLKGAAETFLSLPLVLPPTAVGLVLLELLRRDGVLGRALESLDVEVVFTGKAVVVATAVMSFPLLLRTARTALEEVDPRFHALARTLGCGPLAAFFRVTLPLAWRGIAAGTLLAFSRALGEFGATILVAGNIPGRTQTLALAIFHQVQLGNDRDALRLAAVTAVLAFGAIALTERLTRRAGRNGR